MCSLLTDFNILKDLSIEHFEGLPLAETKGQCQYRDMEVFH